ncbi:nucleic acid-binding protein [Metschnikowia bicuspidata var. bicuspidata NRRL YB-4993]|uniref:Nucleic acid-binding protein n=1 Tax=Metschnikowia bicuspidata var. bicuspidata NRRL YB-4993 TaxID=869754 RepID=A0A1A0HEI7_9ASCO|nr:nucleic acid-binding protein [Metschnikowia bicuspidata var. bicuspidata NRRL YB-4993]OBA22318.1 nucleic acid-binding protein [Metschnikowia bicuspidata var. bicuspidata NRRL YB-4993]
MPRQNFIGLVVSQGKMTKTVKVRVQSKAYDKRVHKDILKRKDYLVHDEGELCKEGDLVRIEEIPKISARKYFAIAEIKVNKGSQFELYEKLAREKVAAENTQKIAEFLGRREQFEATIKKVEDLKTLDRVTKAFHGDPAADKSAILAQVNEIKEKYGIMSWPTTEPVVELELNEAQRDLSVLENRSANISVILDKLMAPEHTEQRTLILEKVTGSKYGDVNELKKPVQKNLLRKYVLDPRNEVPNVL